MEVVFQGEEHPPAGKYMGESWILLINYNDSFTVFDTEKELKEFIETLVNDGDNINDMRAVKVVEAFDVKVDYKLVRRKI